MKLLLHLVRKDLRYARVWIFLTLALSACVLWFPSVSLAERSSHIGWLQISRYDGWVLFCLTIFRLFVADAPLSDVSFLRSKPVPLQALIGSKIIVALIMILPMAFLQCILLCVLGVYPGPLNLALIFMEDVVVLSVIAAISMIFSVQRTSQGRYPSYLIYTVLVTFSIIYGGLRYQEWLFQNSTVGWSYELEYLKTSRELASQVVLLVGGVVTLICFSRNRKTKVLVWGLGITVFGFISSWLFWPGNFVAALVSLPRQAPRKEWPRLSQLHFDFVNPDFSKSSRLDYGQGSKEGEIYQYIRSSYQITGLADGWLPGQNAYSSSISLTNGRILSSSQSAWAPILAESLLPRLGMKPKKESNKNSLGTADLAQYNIGKTVGFASGVTLKGEMQIPLKRATLLARIPFKMGESAHVSGRVVEITSIEGSTDKVTFNLLAQSAMPRLRGGWEHIWSDRFAYIVINRGRGEYLSRKGGGESNLEAGPYALQYLDFDMQMDISDSRKKIPADWLDEAELLIIGEENGGSLNQSYQFNNITLGAR